MRGTVDEMLATAQSLPPERAVGVYSQILRSDPLCVLALAGRINSSASLGNAVDAVSDLKSLKTVAPQLAAQIEQQLSLAFGPLCDLGQQALDDDNIEIARHYFEQAIIYCPAIEDGYLGLGRVELAQRRFNQARKLFERALAIDCDSYYALIGLGDVAIKLRQYREALRFFNQAATIEDEEAYTFARRAFVHECLGNSADAASDRRRAKELSDISDEA